MAQTNIKINGVERIVDVFALGGATLPNGQIGGLVSIGEDNSVKPQSWFLSQKLTFTANLQESLSVGDISQYKSFTIIVDPLNKRGTDDFRVRGYYDVNETIFTPLLTFQDGSYTGSAVITQTLVSSVYTLPSGIILPLRSLKVIKNGVTAIADVDVYFMGKA